MSDKHLLAAVRQNEPWAFEELFNRYWYEMFKAACKKLQSEEDAKDMVQEVWLSLWKNVTTIVIEDSLAPYLFTALRNKILHFFSRNKVKLAYLANQLQVQVKSTSDTQQHIAVKELKLVVDEEVNQMPARMREIYNLSRNTHLSVNDIAEKLNLSPQTVKNQLSSALERLRSRLSGYEADVLVLFFLTFFYCR